MLRSIVLLSCLMALHAAVLPCPADDLKKDGFTQCTIDKATGGTSKGCCCKVGFKRAVANTNDVTCTACDSGKTKCDIMTNDCTACPTGRYSVQVTNKPTECVACTKGKYPNTQKTACDNCAVGKYKVADDDKACIACPNGKYAGAGASDCKVCVKGKYPDAQKSACVDCAHGKYKVADDDKACVDCVAGKYTDAGGKTAASDCKVCLKGKYPDAQKSTCNNCAVGKFKVADDDKACIACPNGKYAGAGASDCKMCLKGNYPDAQKSACVACAHGKYKVADDEKPCVDCVAGKYTDANGKTAAGDCKMCLKGNYPDAKQSACVACAIGKFKVADDEKPCVDCDAGKYTDATGKTAAGDCKICAQGSYIKDTLTGSVVTAKTCTQCPNGRYSDAADSKTCKACKKGFTHSLQGQTSISACVICDPKSPNFLYNDKPQADGTKAVQCVKCIATKVLGLGSCAPGKTNDCGVSCTDCPSGYYHNNKADASVACLHCPEGKYYTDANTDCKVCPSGRFSEAKGQSSCKACTGGKTTGSGGTATDHDASGKCNQACTTPSGSILLGPGGADPTGNSVLTCQLCPDGKMAKADKSGCVKCAKGKAGTKGKCDVCAAGFVAATEGLTACVKCATWKTQADGSGTESIIADNACTPCSKTEQKYSNADGTACLVCPKGKWLLAVTNEKRACVECLASQYNNEISKSNNGCGCKACKAPNVVSSSGQACGPAGTNPNPDSTTKATCGKFDGKTDKKATCSGGKVYNTTADKVECAKTPCAENDAKCCTVSSSVTVGPLLLLAALYLH